MFFINSWEVKDVEDQLHTILHGRLEFLWISVFIGGLRTDPCRYQGTTKFWGIKSCV